ncbi:MAG: NADPH:quinone reductase [Alphaproteobacteria bacterium]|nr:NADPH:quinone reductase [Alphaproteobacteria bacterium]
MKAIVIREFGPPSVMRLEEVPTPVPGPGEVLIEVHAVSVNRTLDLILRAGKYAKKVTLPHVLGADPSGVIVAIGADVSGRKVGDRVATGRDPAASGSAPAHMLGVNAWGGYAQYLKVPVAMTHLIPDGVDFPTATCVARHAPAAFHLLRDRAKVQKGEWVLVMGAAGGLGSVGVQVAKYLGAHVIAGAGADERMEAAVSLGADVGVNYRAQDLTAEVMRVTGGKGVDVVFENIGAPDLFPQAFAALGRNGRLVTAGGHGGGTVPLDVNHLYLNQITVMGATGGSAEDVRLSLEAAAQGKLKALIDQILPLSEAARAHEIVEARNGLGKVLLDPRR